MANQTGATRTRVTKRYWRKTETPATWWPWGVLPLLGLGFVFAYGIIRTAPHIQSQVQTEVTAQLRANGVALRDLSADGQQVTVRALAASDARREILAMAKATDCETWAGRLNCPTSVSVDFLAAPSSVPEVEVPAALMARRTHDFVFRKTGDGVVLSGEVPSDAERKRILGLADARFDKVVDGLTVSDEAATRQFPFAIDRALAVLARFVRGETNWTNGVLAASGVARVDDAGAARELFNASADRPPLGEIVVEVEEDSQRCNDDFRRALTDSTIRFGTGSALIEEGNEDLLQALADLALECTGNLTIAGHTDSSGEDDMNRRLSLGRANSVREALIALGIEAERMDARGFGESQPIADNATAEGRAKNRRIVISTD